MRKNEILDFSGPTCMRLFHPYFVCKYSFREISMIKMVIFDESKPISLILEIIKFKIQKSEICNYMFITHKNKNKTSIQPILKSNSTSFMFNNLFSEINIKKVIHWGGGRENGGTILNSSWKWNYSIYLDAQLHGYPINIYTFMPSIGSWCVIINFSIILLI